MVEFFNAERNTFKEQASIETIKICFKTLLKELISTKTKVFTLLLYQVAGPNDKI